MYAKYRNKYKFAFLKDIVSLFIFKDIILHNY